MGCAESFGELELFVVEIDGNNRIGTGDAGANYGRQTDAADPEYGHTLSRLDVSRADNRTCAGHYRAADD